MIGITGLLKYLLVYTENDMLNQKRHDSNKYCQRLA